MSATAPASATTAPAPTPPSPTAAARLTALGRAELTLLWRSRAALVTALAIPVGLAFAVKGTVDDMDLSGTGLTPGAVLMPGALGFVLLFAVYSNLVVAYVTRREQLVLKRLRTGLLSDREVLAGTAMPSVVISLLQCAVLTVALSAAFGEPAPKAPHLAAAGVVLGMVMLVGLAAATAGLTKSVESAQLTIMPLLMVSMIGSGLVVPLESMPDQMASVAEWLPVTPVMELIRAGWTDALSAGDALRAVAVAAAWTLIAGWAVRRWFRWEPRR